MSGCTIEVVSVGFSGLEVQVESLSQKSFQVCKFQRKSCHLNNIEIYDLLFSGIIFVPFMRKKQNISL